MSIVHITDHKCSCGKLCPTEKCIFCFPHYTAPIYVQEAPMGRDAEGKPFPAQEHWTPTSSLGVKKEVFASCPDFEIRLIGLLRFLRIPFLGAHENWDDSITYSFALSSYFSSSLYGQVGALMCAHIQNPALRTQQRLCCFFQVTQSTCGCLSLHPSDLCDNQNTTLIKSPVKSYPVSREDVLSRLCHDCPNAASGICHALRAAIVDANLHEALHFDGVTSRQASHLISKGIEVEGNPPSIVIGVGRRASTVGYPRYQVLCKGPEELTPPEDLFKAEGVLPKPLGSIPEGKAPSDSSGPLLASTLKHVARTVPFYEVKSRQWSEYMDSLYKAAHDKACLFTSTYSGRRVPVAKSSTSVYFDILQQNKSLGFLPDGFSSLNPCSGFGSDALALIQAGASKVVTIDPNPLVAEPTGELYVQARRMMGPDCPKLTHVVGPFETVSHSHHGPVDVILASPPYGDLEVYSDDLAQTHLRYPSPGTFGHFMRLFAAQSASLLREGGLLILDIQDVETLTGKYNLTKSMLIAFNGAFTLLSVYFKHGKGTFKPIYVWRRGHTSKALKAKVQPSYKPPYPIKPSTLATMTSAVEIVKLPSFVKADYGSSVPPRYSIYDNHDQDGGSLEEEESLGEMVFKPAPAGEGSRSPVSMASEYLVSAHIEVDDTIPPPTLSSLRNSKGKGAPRKAHRK